MTTKKNPNCRWNVVRVYVDALLRYGTMLEVLRQATRHLILIDISIWRSTLDKQSWISAAILNVETFIVWENLIQLWLIIVLYGIYGQRPTNAR